MGLKTLSGQVYSAAMNAFGIKTITGNPPGSDWDNNYKDAYAGFKVMEPSGVIAGGVCVAVNTTVTVGANSATQQVGSTAGMHAGDTLHFQLGGDRVVSSVTDATHVVLTASVNSTTAESITNLTVTIPNGTSYFAGQYWITDADLVFAIPSAGDTYLWGCSDGQIRQTATTTPPTSWDAFTSCIITKGTNPAGTTVTTGANSATQLVGSTSGMHIGDTLHFATAAVDRIISSITDATHVVLTAAVTTVNGEVVTNLTVTVDNTVQWKARQYSGGARTVQDGPLTLDYGANKAYVAANAVDDLGIATRGQVNGKMTKDPVRVITAAALAAYTRTVNVLQANANGALANIDGVAMAVGDRLWLKDGAAGADNGIYTVTDLGSGGTKWVMTRAIDADSSAKVGYGMWAWAVEGTANAGKKVIVSTANPITLNTTAITTTAPS